jgi:class 3 adenylate cyclase/putative methionine-R-sulfoxide reductase with GAF domain
MKQNALMQKEVFNGSFLFLVLRFAVFLLIALSLSVPLKMGRPLLYWMALGYLALSEILLLIRSSRWIQQKIAIGIYFIDVYAVSSLILSQGLSVVWYLTIPVFMLGVSLCYHRKMSWLLISLIPSVLIFSHLFQSESFEIDRLWEFGGVVFVFFVFAGTVHSVITRLERFRSRCSGYRKLVQGTTGLIPPSSLQDCMQKVLEKSPPFETDLFSVLFRDAEGNLEGYEKRGRGEVREVRIGRSRLPEIFRALPPEGTSLSGRTASQEETDYLGSRKVRALLVRPIHVGPRDGVVLMGRTQEPLFSPAEEEGLLLYGEMVQGWLLHSDADETLLKQREVGSGGELQEGRSQGGSADENASALEKRVRSLEQQNRELREAIDRELHSETLELKKAALSVLARESEADQKVLEKLASAELSQAVSHLFDVQFILDLILEVICKKLKVENASIMLLREEKGDLVICAHRGLNDEVVRRTRLMVGEAIAGYVAQKGEPLLIEDIRKDPRFVPFSRERYRSGTLLSVPILGSGRVLGVINLSDPTQDGPFQDRDLEVLQAMSRQAAIAIENDRLYQEFKNGRWIREIYEEELSQKVSEKVFREGQVIEQVAGEYPVTILSIHLHESSSSALTDNRERIDRIENCFRTCRDIVAQHRGDVAGETGVGMIGVFGLPFADPEDAWNAVLAAVDLLKAFAGRDRESGREIAEGFKISLGVTTGVVLLRERKGPMPYAVFGETWERAVALMHAASPGQILVDEETHQKIGGFVKALQLVLPWGFHKQLTAYGIKGLKRKPSEAKAAGV